MNQYGKTNEQMDERINTWMNYTDEWTCEWGNGWEDI